MKYTTYKFTNRNNAFSFAAGCAKAKMVILGDDGKFWVVPMAHGEKLLKTGYEPAS